MDDGFQNSMLYGGCDNYKLCLCGCFCPCVVAGRVAEKVGESCCLCGAVTFFPLANMICRTIIRGKVREEKSIPGSFCKDCIKVTLCAPCTLCQEAMELNAMDLDTGASMSRE